jgi:hypothetical protein
MAKSFGSSAARPSPRISGGNPVAPGIVDWDPASGLSQHVGLRGRAEVLEFDSAVARTIFKKYFGADEDRWDPRFREDIEGETGAPLIRFTPETVVLRDQSYKPPCRGSAT